jgi:transcriptional regulator with XRE-family HTH domain
MAAASFDHHDTAARIRTHREAKAISQDDMARLLDMSFTAYQKLEAGKRLLTVPTLFKLANVLGVDAEAIVPGLTGKYNVHHNSSHDQASVITVNEHAFEKERQLWQELDVANKVTIAAQKEAIKALKLALKTR